MGKMVSIQRGKIFGNVSYLGGNLMIFTGGVGEVAEITDRGTRPLVPP